MVLRFVVDVHTLCFGLHGHLQVCKIFYFLVLKESEYNSKVCLSANKDVTWVIDSVATDHLVQENTHVINKYKLSILNKIHIAKNNNYLLAYEKCDLIGET
jgi:hypothetical protein